MKAALLAPLRHRAFRLLFGGQVVSDLGDWLDFLALIALIVYRWDLGPSALAALSVAVALPFAVIAPLSGVWADRLPRKTLMVAADLGRALVVFGLVFAPNLATILVLVVVRGVFSTFFGPARQATIAAVVPHDDLLAANSLSQLSFQLSKILGPVLGGLLLAAVGPRTAFMVDAVTFLVSAALIVQLPNFGTVPTAPVESDWADLRDAQRRAVAADPHAGLVVTIDIGEPGDLHPGNKRDVGRRLARAARHVVYGEAVPPSGPVVQSARREPDAVVVTFADVTGSLVTYGADVAIGFELCGAAAGTCRYAAGRVDGNRVVLPVAAGSAPTRVRFCWGQSPLANLSDGSELPAGPFELAIDPQQSSGSPGR